MAPEAPIVPAEILHPFPPQLSGVARRGGVHIVGLGAALVVESLGGDEDQCFFQSPIAFAVFSVDDRRRGGSVGGGGGGYVDVGAVEEWRQVVALRWRLVVAVECVWWFR